MAQQVFNPTGTGRTGTVQYFTVPRSGKYIFVAKGAAGFTGSVNRNGTIYTPTPGKGAVVTAEIDLTAGDELLIVVGQRGSSTVSSVSDGSGGGSGGATWVFRKIDTITDSTYQTTINGVDGNWECLLCAAGGCGTIDAAYHQSNATAPDAAVTVYSLAAYGTYKAFSTSTALISSSAGLTNVVLSLNQIRTYGFQGAYHVRNSNYGYGGFGGGHAADDGQSAGGGWAISDTPYRAASWAKYGGTAAVNSVLDEGSLMLELSDQDPPALIVDDIPVSHTPNIEISGTATDPSGVESVTIDGEEALYDETTHRFIGMVTMATYGSKTVTITATDTLGHSITTTRVVTRSTYTPEELHPDNPQPQMIIVIDSVTLLPNPVATRNTFRVTANVSQRYVYPTVEALFEFPMDLSHTGLPLSNIVFS